MNSLVSLLTRKDTIIGTVGSLILVGLWYFSLAPWELAEVFAFVTGAWCVWLTAKENIWNWPIGIVNSAVFVYVFLGVGLYADMSLQVVYIILGVVGWYLWLYGGQNRTELEVNNVSWRMSVVLTVLVAVFTYVQIQILQNVGGSTPLWDALTTSLSLAAQYLLTKKFIENWYVWITADVIYIGLYAYKGLYLTSVLYFVFLCMCIYGLRVWQKSLTSDSQAREPSQPALGLAS